MNLHERQQFEFLLVTTVDRYVERIIQRNQGADNALRKLRDDPQGEGVWLNQFVDAIFQDFLLDNSGGACFVLQALAAQKISISAEDKVETVLIAMAKEAFADLVGRKTEEFLEQQTSLYGGGVSE